jgi:DNA-binding beta-propeller fold protein YncE
MDFNEVTEEVYVPDILHQQLDVITPPDSGAVTAPHEPAMAYHLDAAPQSVAITSDGQFGFAALSDGAVAMLDLPGRQVVRTIKVGGEPRFIITGLYPPALGTTPQQASVLGTLANIAAYLLLGLFVLVPIWYFAKHNRKRQTAKT